VVYGRKIGDKELNFEASGALMDASLVMRDRETDSWWSIMTSTAIGGDLEGAELEEMPVSEKATWKDWVKRHPDTLVLSIEGEEHVDNNPYDNYLESADTFRDLKIEDKRLKAKDSIYAFWIDGEPYAVPHKAFEGGEVFEIEGDSAHRLFVYRTKGSPMFESSKAYLVPAEVADRAGKPKDLLVAIESGQAMGVTAIGGFDTFWYNWVSVNENTKLMK
jgi:hypothetical protein